MHIRSTDFTFPLRSEYPLLRCREIEIRLSPLHCATKRINEQNARDSARATIFKNVVVNAIICGSHMHQWIGNLECLIMAFSRDLQWVLCFVQRHSGV
jgi:hypothetical protein